MSGPDIALAGSVFLACAVEAVEALTIVLAVGVTRGWRAPLAGAGVAALALAAIVAALGPSLVLLPIGILRLVVGSLALMFGLQWLRKAILRAAGAKSKHDELEAFAEQRAAAEIAAATGGRGFDAYSFVVAFKGVLLEGTEVAFIVLALGANRHRVGLAAAAAAAAIVLVVLAGVAIRAPLARVPENTMKFAVGVLLSSFGMFWATEGAGAGWPGGDAALLAIVPAVLGMALVAVRLRAGRFSGRPRRPRARPEVVERAPRVPRAVVLALWHFVAGEDSLSAIGAIGAVALTALAAEVSAAAWVVLPAAVMLVFGFSLWRSAGPAQGVADAPDWRSG